MIFTITPPLAQPATITAMSADEEQIELSAARLTVAARQTMITLRITAVDNDIKEPVTAYTVDLSVAGHAMLSESQITVRVTEDDKDRDTDRAEDRVAENSPVGSKVGITVQVDNATTYTLTDSAGGLFAIHPQSGTVTVAMDMLDYEAFSSHGITVRASNGDDINIDSSFVIQVTNEREPTGPVTDIDFNPNKIALGARTGDTVGITARAIDPDQGSAVSYSLSENPDRLFIINRRNGVVALASDNYDPDQDYLIEVTASSNDGTSSAAQFIIRRDEPIRIGLEPAAPTVEEGTSQTITFSFAEADFEFIAIGAGGSHSCGVTPDNNAVCWGDNSAEQSAPPSDQLVRAVSAGANHSCGITAGNEAACWGSDSAGQRTPPPGRFIAVSAGGNHSCGITPARGDTSGDDTPSGDPVCWGSDSDGQRTPPSGRFIAVSSGANHSCGITAGNDAVCWGSDSAGQSAPLSNRKYVAISAGEEAHLRHHP